MKSKSLKVSEEKEDQKIHYLDGIKNLGFQIHLDETTKEVKIKISSKYEGELVQNILRLMSFGGSNINVTLNDNGEFIIKYNSPAPPKITLKINQHEFTNLEFSDQGVLVSEGRKLTVSETRIIGRHPQTEVPARLEETKHQHQLTDLHTHFAGQVSSADLIDIGVENNIYYPLSMLSELGITYPAKDEYDQVQKYDRDEKAVRTGGAGDGEKEPAILISELSEESREKLKRFLNLSPEKQSIFEDLHDVYYYRQPLVKDLRLRPLFLRKIAEEYKRSGIKYAELSTKEIINPEWLKLIHDCLPEIEKETGVKLRFLVGLPRSSGDKKLRQNIEAVKVALLSPYVVGIDILGYELNKTSEVISPLENLAMWAKDQGIPAPIFRIHAGESSKNPDNVKECLRFALGNGVNIRIGHAIYGMDEETMGLAKQLAQKGLIIIELNPDSNIVLNNIDFHRDTALAKLIAHGIPFVVGTDGAGVFDIPPSEAFRTLQLGGATDANLSDMVEREKAYIEKQQANFTQKNEALPKDFFEQLGAAYPQKELKTKKAPAEPKPSLTKASAFEVGEIGVELSIEEAHFSGLTPVFITGANGSSWNDVKNQQEVRDSIAAILEKSDPDQQYFVVGRVDAVGGVGMELLKAIDKYNETHDKKFKRIIMVTENASMAGDLPAVDKKVKLKGDVGFLARKFTKFLKDHNGVMVVYGGGSFSRDFINEAANQRVDFVLANGCEGASSNKSRIYEGNSCNMKEVAPQLSKLLTEKTPSHTAGNKGFIPLNSSQQSPSRLF